MDKNDSYAVKKPITVEGMTDEPIVASGAYLVSAARAAISPEVGIETPAAIVKTEIIEP